MLHLHVFLWLKNLHTFYSLLKFLPTCEHLLVGNPLHLSNWQTRYSRMTWLLLFHCKVLGIYFTNQNSNGMFLEWPLNTYQGHTQLLITKTSTCISYFCIESCQVLWPLSRVVSCSQDQNSRTHHKWSAVPTLGIRYNMHSHLQNKYSMFYKFDLFKHISRKR
jgi:hypothetical protein